MYININKLESGGGLPPFALYHPVSINDLVASTAKTTSSDSTEEKGITDKDLLTMLKDIDALPSDAHLLYLQIEQFYRLGESGLGMSTQSLSTMYIRAVQKIKEAKYNKDAFDKAYSSMDKDALNEYAISSTGKLLGMDQEGHIKQVSYEDLLKKDNKYSPLTNALLLKFRAESDAFAGDNELIEFASNGISSKGLDALLNQMISKIGQSTNSVEGYSDTRLEEGVKAVQELVKKGVDSSILSSAKGLYKTKFSSTNSLSQVKYLLSYLEKALPENAKTLIKIKAGDNVQLYLLAKLMGETNDSTLLLVDMIEDANGKKPGSSEGSGGAEAEFNSASQFMLGNGPKSTFLILDGSVQGFKVTTTQMPITSSGGEPMGANATLQEVSQSLFAGLLDFTSASMGGKYVDTNSMNKILIRDGKINSIELPIDLAEYNLTGKIKPDIEALHRKEQADAELRKAGIDTNNVEQVKQHLQQINTVYAQHLLPAAYNNNGELISLNYQRFAVFNATAMGSTLGMTSWDEDKLLKEITDDKEIENITETIRQRNKWDSEDNPNHDFFDEDNWYDWNGHDIYYEGTVFIPMHSDIFAAQAGSGQKMKPQQIESTSSAQRVSDRRRQLATQYINPNDL